MIQFANTAIDTIQGAKKTFVETFVTNEEVKKPLLTFINAQSSFAKKMALECDTFFTTIGTSVYFLDPKKFFATK